MYPFLRKFKKNFIFVILLVSIILFLNEKKKHQIKNNQDKKTEKNDDEIKIAGNKLSTWKSTFPLKFYQNVEELKEENGETVKWINFTKKTSKNHFSYENSDLIFNLNDDMDLSDLMEYRERRFQKFLAGNIEAIEPESLPYPVENNGEWGRRMVMENYSIEIINKIIEKEKFNKLLSDNISLDRRLPDFTIKQCRNLTYDRDLPSASVIVVFCNEAPSVVLRTIHSVVNRSPPSLLKEVIAVDDASDRDDLKTILKSHLKTAYPDNIVTLIRSEKRLGLIRARIFGAKYSSGEILVFLDAHCEATHKWLEPLLQRIKGDRKRVVCPLIDMICSYSLGYSRNGGGSVGGFNWNLNFDWQHIPKREFIRRKTPDEPLRSPAMAGGLFAIDKSYFFQLGSYDEGMNIWGGENVEISIRIWTCGGSLELIPCSRVGHMYRKTFPYSLNGQDLNGNVKRVAEVWLDDFKELFYLYRPDLKNKNVGDLTSRKTLRSELSCKPFNWFLKNIYPELFVPNKDVLYSGAICNVKWNVCWDSMGHHSSYGSYSINLFDKQPIKSLNQLFSLDQNNIIKKENKCLTLVSFKNGEKKIRMDDCEDENVALVTLDQESEIMYLQEREKKVFCLQIKKEEKTNKLEFYVTDRCLVDDENVKWKFFKII